MTDKEKVKRVKKLLETFDLSSFTEDECKQEMEDFSIKELKDEWWEIYCILSDIKAVIENDS